MRMEHRDSIWGYITCCTFVETPIVRMEHRDSIWGHIAGFTQALACDACPLGLPEILTVSRKVMHAQLYLSR